MNLAADCPVATGIIMRFAASATTTSPLFEATVQRWSLRRVLEAPLSQGRGEEVLNDDDVVTLRRLCRQRDLQLQLEMVLLESGSDVKSEVGEMKSGPDSSGLGKIKLDSMIARSESLASQWRNSEVGRDCDWASEE
ncbi:DNA-directed RNA polymerase subunit alpha [Striga asiatica]|uniref:DNA-directed RNA polymerase subunit alpha n=1 Tax=Striga asiatica TaxID=4170 RepID=A0A5A7QPW8_STRAF|nr:DNA-directed RNA polymerase subunit alpha [Striga asiatica]